MLTRSLLALCLLFGVGLPAIAANQLTIDINIPELDVNPYHKPYVAIWLETPKRQYVTTIQLWADDMEWYKDLRQWWRKASRSKQSFDGATGATKKPGNYQIKWTAKDANGKPLPAGDYLLKIEASREEGGREFIKSKITIDQQANLNLVGKRELGQISITTQVQE
ncbi:DUF2271 domain-containing protein [Paraglaciecola aquimarina]|uniref:DUF2271 domain-containing protein n=1 Tax=Paraglaciecola algarum TaxID=3050085 RepID=A0ABS9D4X6_9ALTE|nr:DUF2271 domain-containing protein [Paraglaciecola sp. G1-23]MCF2947998.1 DUF2271 domain-containing protein [Paraglaciecola sp. G1-23]